ncbi:sensor histidine kinase [Nocardia huaxiensis]|uniref:histidine kinase n=1 Tax=Nocardia huaxiensis TaxID=2755382 RepID=A0A7D6Z1H0_9NOCA|nr:sensor histidine kinase [Nocardia huaxiensis]QLY28264.1 sensor histidine kinase [Nocardia huaxiensis]
MAARGRGLGGIGSRPADLLLGGVLAAAIALIIALGQGGHRSPDVFAYLFAAGFGASMLVRRRFPVLVVVVTVAGIFGYYALRYPPIGVAVPLAGALFAAADAGQMWWAVGAAALVYAVALWYRLNDGESAAYLVGYEGVSNVALIVTALALGFAVRSRRLRTLEQAEIGRLTSEQVARQAELRLRTERERLSRDLHDTVGHLMALISVQAGVAAEAIGRDDAAVRTAVGHIRDTSRRSLRDVRAMVRMLRDEGVDARKVLRLAEVPALAADTRGAGVAVTFEPGSALERELPPQVDATAYRLVQEALTNVVRHAHATEARVVADIADGALHLAVIDNGRAEPGSNGDCGHGLAGMRERVRLLGGTLTTGPAGTSGFAVRARIPLEAVQ